MLYPTLTEVETARQMVSEFKGYNHNLRISDGEFFDMKNLTSDCYPVFSPRQKRGLYASPRKALGMIAKDALCYIDGTDFVMNGYPVDMGLSDEPKQLISMGAYVIILPDKKYINTLDLSDRGNIEASFVSAGDVTFELCTANGERYTNTVVSATEPENPENMDMWIDTSATPHALKQYSASSGMWVSIATTYIRIGAAGIGKPFSQFDGVTISGIQGEALQALNGTMVIWDKGEDYIVVVGILDRVTTQAASEGAITVERRMPNMDFICEAENRLWGCRYGVAANGEVVNELYGCKLGDFKNWNCFMGIATDSWAASLGSDGQFTGGISLLGHPTFWKEGICHKIYISATGAHQVQDTVCRGVQKGCEKSMAIVNETLFYKARSGICIYDGSLPTEASYALGNGAYSQAVGGSHGNKYYVSMKDAAGNWHLFVYDTARGMWHREDGLQAVAFCSCGEEMYCIDAATGKILTMLGSGMEEEQAVEWMAETGELGISSPDMKYVSRLTVRMSMEIGAVAEFFVQYDMSREWQKVGTIRGTSLRSFSIPIRPRRCDHLRLRITGKGAVKIYSITKTVEEGSDIS